MSDRSNNQICPAYTTMQRFTTGRYPTPKMSLSIIVGNSIIFLLQPILGMNLVCQILISQLKIKLNSYNFKHKRLRWKPQSTQICQVAKFKTCWTKTNDLIETDNEVQIGERDLPLAHVQPQKGYKNYEGKN